MTVEMLMPDESSVSEVREVVLDFKAVITSAFDAALSATAVELGESRAEVIRRGFNLLALALEVRRRGLRLVVVDDEAETEQEISI